MTEEQLRDVLSRVVPDPPDSVADPRPVARAARVRRRAQVVGVVGVMALVAVVGVVGSRAFVDDDASPQVTDDPSPEVAEEPSLAVDPYAAAGCPAKLPKNGEFPVDADVEAVRYCGGPAAGFPSIPGPPDALVDDVDSFIDAVTALPAADPARCAAISMMPGDDRLLVQLADGSSVTVAAAGCQDVDAGGRRLDGGAVAHAFLAALNTQRDAFSYSATDTERPPNCDGQPALLGLAQPAREALMAATWCVVASGSGDPLDAESLAALSAGWRQAVVDDGSGEGLAACSSDPLSPPPFVAARTDRGDLVRFDPCSADQLIYAGVRQTYRLAVDSEVLTAS